VPRTVEGPPVKYTKSEFKLVLAFMSTYFGFAFAAIYIPALSPYYDAGKYTIVAAFMIIGLIHSRVTRGSFFPGWHDRANQPPFLKSPEWRNLKFFTAWILFVVAVLFVFDQWTKYKPVQWPSPDVNVNIFPTARP
jgi:hypothetical protein